MNIFTGKSSDFVKFALSSASRGNLVEVKQCLNLRPDWLHRIGPHGRTMLWEAAYSGKTSIVQYLLSQGADPNLWGCYFTPMLVEVSAYAAAVWKQREETARFLLDFYCPIDIFSASFLGDTRQVKELIEQDPNQVIREQPQQDQETGFTALHYAISGGQRDVLAHLIERGANPKPDAHRLVRFALWRGDSSVFQLLLETGIVPKLLKWEPVFEKNSELSNLLHQFGIKIDPNLSEHGWPPLVYESRGDRGGNPSRIRALLDLGAQVNCRNYKGETALHCASKAGFIDVVELLIKRGAYIDVKDDNGLTPLQHALRSTIKNSNRRARVIFTLLESNASTKDLTERDCQHLESWRTTD